MAFTGLAFDSNHVPGDYDFSLVTITEIILQVILLLCPTGAVMLVAEKTRGTVTSKRPACRLEVSMPPVIERSTTDNVCARSRLSHCSRCLANRVLRGITFLHSYTPVFSFVTRSAPLDVHYASAAVTFSDCRHHGN